MPTSNTGLPLADAMLGLVNHAAVTDRVWASTVGVLRHHPQIGDAAMAGTPAWPPGKWAGLVADNGDPDDDAQAVFWDGTTWQTGKN